MAKTQDVARSALDLPPEPSNVNLILNKRKDPSQSLLGAPCTVIQNANASLPFSVT